MWISFSVNLAEKEWSFPVKLSPKHMLAEFKIFFQLTDPESFFF